MAATHYQIFCRYYHATVNRAVFNDIYDYNNSYGWISKSNILAPSSMSAFEMEKRTDPQKPYFTSENMTNLSNFEDAVDSNDEVTKKKLFFKLTDYGIDLENANDTLYPYVDKELGNRRFRRAALENVWIRFEDYLLAQQIEGADITASQQQVKNLSAARNLDAVLNEIITEEGNSDNPKYDMMFIYDGIAQEKAAPAQNTAGNKYNTPQRVWTYYGSMLWKLPKKYRLNDNALKTWFNGDEPTDIAVDLDSDRYDASDIGADGKPNPGAVPIGKTKDEGFTANVDFSEGIKVIVDPDEFNETYSTRLTGSGAYTTTTGKKMTGYVYKAGSSAKTYLFSATDPGKSGESSADQTEVYYFITRAEAEGLLLGSRSSLTVDLFQEDGTTNQYTKSTKKTNTKINPDQFVAASGSIADLQLYTYNNEVAEVTDNFELEEASGITPYVYYEKFKRFEFSPWFVYANCGSLKQAMTKAEELVNIVGIDNLIIGKVVDLTQYIEIA